uniref:hypothetical protein n=1 Tax=Enterocloster clostridioformis TaxID=1531 RepID=UPI001C3D013F|nr:hypothetical protein [Enterocloster clostridioformis]
MTVRFMGNTPSSDFEIEMQRIPEFRPRRSGMVVSHGLCRYRGYADSGGCRRKNGTGENVVCPCERFWADSRPFGELLEQFATEVAVSPFVDRVSRVAARNPPVFFLAGHRGRFKRLWEKHEGVADEDAMCAAVYLLSADPFLWGRAFQAVDPDIIRFQEIRIHGVDLDGYVLFHTAKDLYKGTCHISISELIDPELVSEDTFRLVISAFLIRRYGTGVLFAAERGMPCRV